VHLRELARRDVGGDRDAAVGARRHLRERQVVLARELHEALADGEACLVMRVRSPVDSLTPTTPRSLAIRPMRLDESLDRGAAGML
jgi:hypothetical protein